MTGPNRVRKASGAGEGARGCGVRIPGWTLAPGLWDGAGAGSASVSEHIVTCQGFRSLMVKHSLQNSKILLTYN